VVPYECMCDFNPELWTTFWTSAIYFVTEDSTPTIIREGGERMTRDKAEVCYAVEGGSKSCHKISSVQCPDLLLDHARCRLPSDWP
jgi:hypothetical protein